MQDVWGSKSIPAMGSLQSKDPEHIERGTPKELIELRKAKEGPYTMYDSYQDICNQQNSRRMVVVTPDDIKSEFRVERVLNVQMARLEVSEQLFPEWKDELSLLNKEALCIVSDMWPLKARLQEGKLTMNYQCLPGESLFDIATDALYGDHIEGYIPILHQLACLLKAFHDAKWMVNCLRSRNVYVVDDKFLSRKENELKVFIPNIGRFARMQMHNNCLLESTILERDPALQYWQSPEVIQNNMHSPKSDVFSYARLVSEVSGILHYSRKIKRRTNRIKKIERYSVPCGNMRKSEILPHIYSDKGPPEYDTATKRIYDEVIVRGVNSEKHHRPSMADLIDTWEDIAKQSRLKLSRPNIQLVKRT
ncbi:uncharacterized protein LOC125672928 [Ostrea edulis]|uniref:uncharacterized protein LOC125672928 n=1 Tax=Ostrea edulis TaxID=37623 RepID=UPI0024AFFCE6|nr:uncharacterized protein LOC125672928 [Ostrea edulis]